MVGKVAKELEKPRLARALQKLKKI